MRRKHGEVSHNNNERWLLTYADMITLLMAFFIMMYSMSVLNVSKFHVAAVSIRSGFGGLVKGQGKSVLGSSGSFSTKPSAIEKGDLAGAAWRAIKPLVSYIEKDPLLRKSMLIGQDDRGIVISMLSDNMLFDPGSAGIKERAYPLLDRIAEMLDTTANRIRIEGYTCDLPPRNTDSYPTNWELSTARSINVLRYLTDLKGLDGRRFSVAGYAGSRPVVPNTCEENRRKNRRVDIVIVTDEMPVPREAGTEKSSKAQTFRTEIKDAAFPKRIVPLPVETYKR